jgi:hypothetical protein
MISAIKFAAIGLALAAAAAPAQNPQEPALSDANIVKPEHPTRDNRLHIGFVYNAQPSAPPLQVAAAGATVSGLVNGETLTLDDAITLKPECPGSAGFPLVVTADGRCRISATLKDIQTPGLYSAKVWLVGQGGGRQEVKLDFARRGPLWWAIALVLLGLATGLVVTTWRGGGRDRAGTAIAIKDAIEDLTRLDAGSGRPPRTGLMVDRALELEAAVVAGNSFDAAEVAELRLRPNQYRFLRAIEAQGSDLSADKQQQLAVTVDAAIEAMNPTPNGPLAAVPLATLVAVREKLKELKAPPAGALAATSGPAAADVLPLPITLRMSARTARLAFAIAERGVAAILMLLFAVSALGTLYYGKSYWGSYGDLLAAFMVGFGAYAGAVASVDNFLQRARTVPTYP